MPAALSLAALAHAQCEPAAGASELTIHGFASAYFQQFRTDTANGTVELYGGVCLVGGTPAWTLAAERVTVRGLKGELRVLAAGPTLTAFGWSVQARELEATGDRLDLRVVRLTGHGVDGNAERAQLDLASGGLTLTGIDLHGAAFYLQGDVATVDGDRMTVTAPRVTSCRCSGPPLYRVTGASARVDVQAERIVLTGGHVDVGGVQVPLANEATIDAQTLRALTLPITVEYVESSSTNGSEGTGLNVILTHLGLAPGVYARVGAAGLDGGHTLAGVALLKGSSDGASFTFGKASTGMRFEAKSDHALTPWFDAGFDTTVLEPGNRDTLREGVLHGRFHTEVAPLGGSAALTLFAAASSQQPSAGEVAGARLGGKASLTAASPAGEAWGRASMWVGVQASAYPDHGATQWGVDIEPGYALKTGPLALTASYKARFTDGGSPFTTSLDRLEPVERPSATVSVKGGLAPGWRASARLAARYDLIGTSSVDAGLNRLDVGASVTRTLGDWKLTASGDAVLAGVLAPNGERDGYLEAGLAGARGGFELGALARFRYEPTADGLDLLQVSAAVPVRVPGVELRPYLALDFAPTVRAGVLPAISGHGLDVTLPTCCGALKLGYRDDRGTWTLSFAVDLQTGSAATAGAASCPSAQAVAPVIVPRNDTPGQCPAASGTAGIMTGAATGPPP